MIIPPIYKFLHITRKDSSPLPAYRIQRSGFGAISNAVQGEHLYAFFISIHPLGCLVKKVFTAFDLGVHPSFQQFPLRSFQLRLPIPAPCHVLVFAALAPGLRSLIAPHRLPQQELILYSSLILRASSRSSSAVASL